jgi:hypothetical protein
MYIQSSKVAFIFCSLKLVNKSGNTKENVVLLFQRSAVIPNLAQEFCFLSQFYILNLKPVRCLSLRPPPPRSIFVIFLSVLVVVSKTTMRKLCFY